jgi:hypothetical protein
MRVSAKSPIFSKLLKFWILEFTLKKKKKKKKIGTKTGVTWNAYPYFGSLCFRVLWVLEIDVLSRILKSRACRCYLLFFFFFYRW